MRRDAGFTLIETLVALTLLSLVAALLFGGLRFGARSWDAAADKTSAQAEMEATRAFLTARLEAISRPGATDGAAPGGLSGEPGALSFTAPWSRGPAEPGLYRFAIAKQGQALRLAWRQVGGGGSGERTLMTGLSGLSFAYFGAPGPDDANLWRGSWAPGDASPTLIRMEVAFAEGAQAWPPLIVRRRR